MSQQIPLAAVPSQRLSVPALGGQDSQINVYQRGDSLYFDLALDGVPIVTTKACRNEVPMLLASRYLGYKGDFVFLDTQGDQEPHYTGLGSRWFLVYLTEAEVATLG